MSNFFPLFFIPSGTQHIFPSSSSLGYHFLSPKKKSVKTKRFLLTSGATYYICSKLFSRQLISTSLHCTPFNPYYISHCFTVPFIKFPCLIQLHTRTVIPEQKLRALHGGSRNPYGGIFHCQMFWVCLISAQGTCYVRDTLWTVSAHPTCVSEGKL